MKYSTDRILATHAGALPQPPDLKEMHTAQAAGKPVEREAFEKRVRDAVSEAVRKQIACGIDIINDGEVGKSNFSRYARERLSGFIERDVRAEDRPSTIYERDVVEFADAMGLTISTIHPQFGAFLATTKDQLATFEGNVILSKD